MGEGQQMAEEAVEEMAEGEGVKQMEVDLQEQGAVEVEENEQQDGEKKELTLEERVALAMEVALPKKCCQGGPFSFSFHF